MSLKAKVVRKGNSLKSITDELTYLMKQNVEVGHFKESGTHYSGYTYPELMALHHNPVVHGFEFPPRPVIDILFYRNERLNAPEIRKAVFDYARSKPTRSRSEAFLSAIGDYLVKSEKAIFGSSDLPPNAPSTVNQKGRNEPLVDHGDLKSKTSHKNSISQKVREGS